MFQRLHLRLTAFCTLVTGAILVGLTLLCLIVTERGIRENYYASFLSELHTTLSHLQEQDVISQRWVGTLAAGSMQICLYDRQAPLFDDALSADPSTAALAPELIRIAAEEYEMDIFPTGDKKLSAHTEFSYTAQTGRSFYVSAGYIPKNDGLLSFLILSPQDAQQRQCRKLRLLILFSDIAALFGLALFSRWFTGRMIVPLKQAQEKQTLFIASASHELRRPLAVLRSGLEVLEKTDDPAQSARTLSVCFDEITHSQRLVKDMLLLASADAGALPLSPAPCQPDSILLNAYETYEALAKRKGLRLTLSLPEDILPDCGWDRERIGQVCAILIDNAISYTPEGGAIELAMTAGGPGNSAMRVREPGTNTKRADGETGDRVVRMRAFAAAGTDIIRICVTDSGPGIPDEEKAHIFDRFYRIQSSRSEKEHFGLGLCIAKEIVTAHGGTIRAEDAPGGGSRFVCELPAGRRLSR